VEDCCWDEEDEYLISVDMLHLQPANDNDIQVDPLDYDNDIEFADSDSHSDVDFEDNDAEEIFIEELPVFEEEEGEMRVSDIDPEQLPVIEEIVEGWPSVVIEEDTKCMYCHEEIEVGTEGTKLPYCPHIFHKDCCIQWFAPRTDGIKRKGCVICRQKTLPDDDDDQ